MQVASGADAEFGEDIAQVPFDRPPGQEQLGADLRVGDRLAVQVVGVGAVGELAVGHPTQAAALLRQALEIFQRTGAAEAGDVSRELAALAEAGPPA